MATHSVSRGGVVAVALAVLALSTMKFALAATEHHVGSGTCDADPSWSPDNQCDFNAWSQKQDFVVGDSIVFTFTYGDSNVALVSKDDYDTCMLGVTTPTTYMNYWSASPVLLNLPGAGTFYFISDLNEDDCTATNLKMTIVVKTTAGTAAPPSNSPPSPAAIPIVIIVPTAAPSGGSHKSSIVGPVVGGTVGFVFLAAKLSLIAHCAEKRREKRKLKEEEEKKKQEEIDNLREKESASGIGSGSDSALPTGGDLVKGVLSSLKGTPDNSGKGGGSSKGNRNNLAKGNPSSNDSTPNDSDHEDAHSHV